MALTNATGDLMIAAEVCSNDEHPVADAVIAAMIVKTANVWRRLTPLTGITAVVERSLFIVVSMFPANTDRLNISQLVLFFFASSDESFDPGSRGVAGLLSLWLFLLTTSFVGRVGFPFFTAGSNNRSTRPLLIGRPS
jgi:hypothetical protein